MPRTLRMNSGWRRASVTSRRPTARRLRIPPWRAGQVLCASVLLAAAGTGCATSAADRQAAGTDESSPSVSAENTQAATPETSVSAGATGEPQKPVPPIAPSPSASPAQPVAPNDREKEEAQPAASEVARKLGAELTAAPGGPTLPVVGYTEASSFRIDLGGQTVGSVTVAKAASPKKAAEQIQKAPPGYTLKTGKLPDGGHYYYTTVGNQVIGTALSGSWILAISTDSAKRLAELKSLFSAQWTATQQTSRP